MSDSVPEPYGPETLPPHNTSPALTDAIRKEIPAVLAWLSGIDEVNVEGVPPYDVAAGLAADYTASEAAKK